MKWVPFAEVVVVNAFLIPLLALITENYGLRMAYFVREGFVPTMTRYPFFFITSVTGASPPIPGLLSVDWQQVVLIVLLVTDAVYVYSATRAGRRPPESERLGAKFM